MSALSGPLKCLPLDAPPSLLPSPRRIRYDQCERCSTPDCQVLEDYRARLWEAEAAVTDILTQSMQLAAGTASPPSLSPPPPSDPPAAAFIVFNPLAHDRLELVNLCVQALGFCCCCG